MLFYFSFRIVSRLQWFHFRKQDSLEFISAIFYSCHLAHNEWEFDQWSEMQDSCLEMFTSLTYYSTKIIRNSCNTSFCPTSAHTLCNCSESHGNCFCYWLKANWSGSYESMQHCMYPWKLQVVHKLERYYYVHRVEIWMSIIDKICFELNGRVIHHNKWNWRWDRVPFLFWAWRRYSNILISVVELFGPYFFKYMAMGE